jgi:hypothetical protein
MYSIKNQLISNDLLSNFRKLVSSMTVGIF